MGLTRSKVSRGPERDKPSGVHPRLPKRNPRRPLERKGVGDKGRRERRYGVAFSISRAAARSPTGLGGYLNNRSGGGRDDPRSGAKGGEGATACRCSELEPQLRDRQIHNIKGWSPAQPSRRERRFTEGCTLKQGLFGMTPRRRGRCSRGKLGVGKSATALFFHK